MKRAKGRKFNGEMRGSLRPEEVEKVAEVMGGQKEVVSHDSVVKTEEKADEGMMRDVPTHLKLPCNYHAISTLLPRNK